QGSLSTKRVADLALEHRLPAASTTRGFADVGGLMSYGADGPALFRQSARFVHRILQGRQPNDLPIEQPTKFELAVNLKTAKAMGLAISESFLLRAEWPLAARAQERVPRLGALIAYTEDNAEAQRWVAAFRDGLQQLGWVEGRNLRIDFRWGGNEVNMLQKSAKEIVAANPNRIFSSGSPTTRMLKQQPGTSPVVFGNLVDPVGQGFVASLARPGGNVTGFVNLEPFVVGKYVELLKEIPPRLTRVAIFYNPATAPSHGIYPNPL